MVISSHDAAKVGGFVSTSRHMMNTVDVKILFRTVECVEITLWTLFKNYPRQDKHELNLHHYFILKDPLMNSKPQKKIPATGYYIFCTLVRFLPNIFLVVCFSLICCQNLMTRIIEQTLCKISLVRLAKPENNFNGSRTVNAATDYLLYLFKIS